MIRRYIEAAGAYLDVALNSVLDRGELDQPSAASPLEITLQLHGHSTALRTSYITEIVEFKQKLI